MREGYSNNVPLEAEWGPPLRAATAEQSSGAESYYIIQPLIRTQLEVGKTQRAVYKSRMELIMCDRCGRCQTAVVMGISIDNGATSNAQQAKNSQIHLTKLVGLRLSITRYSCS